MAKSTPTTARKKSALEWRRLQRAIVRVAKRHAAEKGLTLDRYFIGVISGEYPRISKRDLQRELERSTKGRSVSATKR